MPTSKSDLYVITLAKKLADYVLQATEKAPKRFRYSYLSKIENVSLEIVMLLYEANDTRLGNAMRRKKQDCVVTRLKILDFLSEEAMKNKCFLSHQYEVISKMIYDCNKSLLSWMKSDQERMASLQ